jgi:hypothetical protein
MEVERQEKTRKACKLGGVIGKPQAKEKWEIQGQY